MPPMLPGPTFTCLLRHNGHVGFFFFISFVDTIAVFWLSSDPEWFHKGPFILAIFVARLIATPNRKCDARRFYGRPRKLEHARNVTMFEFAVTWLRSVAIKTYSW